MKKYLQAVSGLTPLIILILCIYLSNTVPGFAYIEWVLLAIVLILGIAAYLNTSRIIRNVNAGYDLPSILTDFPIYETSDDEYRQTRRKMEAFILAVEAGQPSQVDLSVDELNCLSTKGKTPSRSGFSFSLPEYYRIHGGKVYSSAIALVPWLSYSGYWTFKSEIKFVHQDERFSVIGHLVERNSKVRSAKKRPVVFETHLFTDLLCLDSTTEWFKSTELVLNRLQSVEVIEDQLILKA